MQRARVLLWLWMWMVVGALGCKPYYKSAGGYAAEAAGVGYGGDYGYDDYARYEDAPPADGDYRKTAERELQSVETKQRFKHANTPATIVSEDATAGSEPPPAPEAEPDETSTQTHGRQIIYTAGMGLSVFDVDDVMARLEAIPERHGGWLHQRYDNRVVLRVPAEKLQSVIAEIAQWGVVEWKTLEALDVTAEYTDLDSRIRVLEQMQQHLQALLERAQNVEQALEIQVELARITAELERLRAQMRMLESSIAFSTLAVELRERSTVVVEPGHDPFPWVDQLGAEATAYK